MFGCKKNGTVDNAQIYGLWQEQDEQDFMRFLTANEEAKEGDYQFGKEWDEGDGVKESDLKYKGNGWFKWKINETTLTRINLMDNGSAEIPKTYIIKELTSTKMVLQESDDRDDVETWTKR